MKHVMTGIVVLFVVVMGSVQQGNAQWDYLDVPQGYETLNLAIEGDTTAAGEAKSLNRVYRLERGGMYLLNGHVANIKGAPMRIWAADGAGPKPLIIMAVNQSGANDDVAYLEGDGHFKNLYLSGIDNIGIQDRYTMAVYDTGARVVWEGVHIDHSRQSHIRVYGVNTRLFFRDCEFRNSIDLATPSNGRFFDGRGLAVDTIMYQNCTIYLNSQRMFRTDGAVVNTIIMDHNTFYQNAYGAFTTTGTKQAGPLETRRGVNVRITNNIFQDLCTEALRHPKTLNPPDRLPLIAVDSLGSPSITEESRNWIVRNNAYGWAPEFKSFWAGWGIDTLVKAPTFISPYGDSVFFKVKPNFVQSGNFEELVQFTDAPSSDSLLKYVRYRFTSNFTNSGNPDPRADRNGIGDLTTKPETFGIETNPFNFDYPTTQRAYTAGDGGFPVGDLNWFPAKKAAWQAVNGVDGVHEAIVTDYQLEQNYPNPFNPATRIAFALPYATRVTLTIYNAIGQQIVRLINREERSAGQHSAFWNGKDASGTAVPSGVYFYRLQSPQTQITKKMVLMK
jgi:hypothetical protein